MNYFEFDRKLMETATKPVLDETFTESAAKAARESTPPAPHGMQSSAKVIAQYSRRDKILSAEEMDEHRKYCKARPGNCPFEKARDELDDVTPSDIKITKQMIFNRFASLLTQMFKMAKNLAVPAIADKKEVKDSAGGNAKATQDEAALGDTNEDAKLVAEVIEAGINKMVEMAKNRGCRVNMDDKKTKYIVIGPPKDTESKTSA